MKERAPARVRALWATPWITSPGLSVALSEAQNNLLWAIDAMVRGQPDHFGPSSDVVRWHFVNEYLIRDDVSGFHVFNSEGQRQEGFIPIGDETTVETYYNGKARYAYYPTERDNYVQG